MTNTQTRALLHALSVLSIALSTLTPAAAVPHRHPGAHVADLDSSNSLDSSNVLDSLSDLFSALPEEGTVVVWPGFLGGGNSNGADSGSNGAILTTIDVAVPTNAAQPTAVASDPTTVATSKVKTRKKSKTRVAATATATATATTIATVTAAVPTSLGVGSAAGNVTASSVDTAVGTGVGTDVGTTYTADPSASFEFISSTLAAGGGSGGVVIVTKILKGNAAVAAVATPTGDF